MTSKNNVFDQFLQTLFGVYFYIAERVFELKAVEIQHFETDLVTTKTVEVAKDADGNPLSIERRFCLAGLFPEFKTSSFTLKKEGDSPTASELLTFYSSAYYEVFGGTGLNKGQFYATQGMPVTFGLADEAISYLSLLYTPLAQDINGHPMLYKMNILIISDKEMRENGLVEGNTAILMNDKVKINGQIRILINNASIGKGAAFSALDRIGVKIREEYYNYDIILSESHIKVNKLQPEAYEGYVGFTYDNTWTVSGPVGHSFEFYQYIKYDNKLNKMILDNFVKTDYERIMVGEIKGKVIQAAKNNEQYQPTLVDTAVQQGFYTFGPSYPAVNEYLQKRMLRWLINSRMPESSMKIVVMTTDEIKLAIKETSKSKANAVLYKFPITAGLAKVEMPDAIADLPYYPIAETTCKKYNIDGDGDIANVNRGSITDYVIAKGLIKQSRDIAVESREKNKSEFSLKNIAKATSRILSNNGLIGIMTLVYYRADMALEMLDKGIDVGISREDILQAIETGYKGIESIIKSNKWDMDLSILEKRNFKVEKTLRNLVSDIWREKYWSKDMETLFDGDATSEEKVSKFVAKYTIAKPFHYMDNIWNYCLSRSITEIQNLQKIRKPLSYFKKMVDPQIITNKEEHDADYKLLKKLNYMFNLSFRKDSEYYKFRKEIVELTKQITQGISNSALSDFTEKFLDKSKGTGMFLLYFYHLSDIIDGSTATRVVVNKDRLAKAVENMFGAEVVDLEEAVMKSGHQELIIWRGRGVDEQGNRLTGRSINKEEFAVGTTIEIAGGEIVAPKAFLKFATEDGTYEVVDVQDSYDQKGLSETRIKLFVKKV